MDSALPERSDRRPIVHGVSSLQQSSAVHQLLPHPVCAHSATTSLCANAAFPASKRCPRSQRGAPRWPFRLARIAPQSPAGLGPPKRNAATRSILKRLSGCCPATPAATRDATAPSDERSSAGLGGTSRRRSRSGLARPEINAKPGSILRANGQRFVSRAPSSWPRASLVGAGLVG